MIWRRIFPVLSCLLIASSALADFSDFNTSPVSEAQAVQVQGGLLRNETFAVMPQFGAFAFKDINGSTASRGAIGLAFDLNLANLGPQKPPGLFVGLSTGALYSHVGGPDANFFGYNSAAPPGTPVSNVVIVPVDIKLGYALTDSFRASVHGGANVIYNSVPDQIQLGSTSNWNLYPDVGADLEFAFAPQAVVGIRPDFTFAPGSDFFTGTVQLGYFFG